MATYTQTKQAKGVIEDAFAALTQSNCQYVVLEGYEKLPIDYPGRIQLLCVDVDSVVRVMGLHRLYPKQPIFGFRFEGEQNIGVGQLEIAIKKKGTGYMPETFESEMLGRNVIKEKFVRILGIEEAFWYRLWKILYFTSQIRNHDDRMVLASHLNSRIGPARQPKQHPDITFYKALITFSNQMKMVASCRNFQCKSFIDWR